MIPAIVVENTLLYLVMPLWIVSGVADWLCHRIARIEYSAGPLESAIHLLMMAEAGLAVLAALFLEINGAVLIFLFAMWFIHEATSYWDLHFASTRRIVAPWEQRVHDYLANTPVLALVLVAVLHWEQLAAVVGAGPQQFDGSVRLKSQPLSTDYIVLVLATILIFNVMPFVLEFAQGVTSARKQEVRQRGVMIAHRPYSRGLLRQGRISGRSSQSRQETH
jgi:hypothetical protein